MWLSLSLLLVLTILAVVATAFDRQVAVNIKADWRRCEGSVAAELSEFLAEEGQFWQYTDSLCNSSAYMVEEDVSARKEKEEGELSASDQSALDIASKLLPAYTEEKGGYYALMKTTVLGLRTYSPTIQFFETLANQYVLN